MRLDLPDRLERRLAEPLPGSSAQRRFEADLSYGRHAGPAPEDAREAAVLLSIYPFPDDWHLVLTRRPEGLTDHPGQISLPGGELEYGESTRHAAQREMSEELGVALRPRLLGRLTELYVFVSNFRVTPWVGVLEKRPDWKPNSQEVAEVFEIPLSILADKKNHVRSPIEHQGLKVQVPSFRIGRSNIWGATAMILSEMIQVFSEATADSHNLEA